MPYEFECSQQSKEDAIDLSRYSDFLQDFMDILTKNGLEGTLSLRRFPGHGCAGNMEITQGSVLLNFMPGHVSDRAPNARTLRHC
jgi:hypothetical protein